MTTHTITRSQLANLRPGDRITAIDGRSVDYTVIRPLGVVAVGRKVQAVVMSKPGYAGHVNLYPDTHVERDVTFERAEPRPRTRKVNGVVFTSTDGGWWSPGRRYRAWKGFGGYTECEGPHPMRISPALAEWASDRVGSEAAIIRSAIANGKRGYLCEGGAEHSYDEWQAWDYVTGDYAPGLMHADTCGEALADLAAIIALNGE